MMLNIHSMRLSVDTNGPGRRIVIWTQGCTLNCPGCFNPIHHAHKPKVLMDVDELSELVFTLLQEHECEGVTFSGGEPFQQAKAVLQLSRNIHDWGYSVVIFSGYTVDELISQHNPTVLALFRLPDILILGRFQSINRHTNRSWNYNPDKKFLYNTSVYSNTRFENPPNIEFTVESEDILITGFPTNSELQLLKDQLAEEAIILK